MEASSTSRLLRLPHEILHCICLFLEPQDLPTLCRTSRQLDNYIKNNRLLHKELYLQHYDPPSEVDRDAVYDWVAELQRNVSLKKTLESESMAIKDEAFTNAAATVINLLQQTPPVSSPSKNLEFLAGHFENQANIDAFLCRSSLFGEEGLNTQPSATSAESRQLSAKLHCYYGVPIDPCGRRVKPSHPFARARVYDLRNYTDGTLWGPFNDDGSQQIDWEKMESTMIVLGYNLRMFNERAQGRSPARRTKVFTGIAPRSFIPHPSHPLRQQPYPSIIDEDPYDITGEWMRVVCFLDYPDLYNFNFSDNIPSDAARPPLEHEEAIRLITMRLRVTKIEPPQEDDGKGLPRVHFTGKSWSMHAGWDPNANSNIRGQLGIRHLTATGDAHVTTGIVRLTPEGEVRWTTFSVFHGIERWRSEGIQLGGPQSDRGVVGSWFDKDFDPEGPAGPTSFWKTGNEVPDEIHYNAVNFPTSE
ncbi:MAG: hypothetical protein M1828_006406 [Chrysothrix sp. TS-e1954]|nr:MAG: hypothetical protein M1828_006406 [Chrysothrix sp. TS-e1954]